MPHSTVTVPLLLATEETTWCVGLLLVSQVMGAATAWGARAVRATVVTKTAATAR